MAIYQGEKKIAYNLNVDNTVYCVPIGSIISYSSTTLPKGFLLCDGSEIDKTTYADLYAVVGDSFGTATDTTKFKLPDLRDKFVQGANGNLGESKSAGLPNIEGYIGNEIDGLFAKTSGCFVGVNKTSEAKAATMGSDDTPIRGANFDASASNSIYGNSTTVQPPAVCLCYIIKATKLSDIPVDVSGVINDDTTTTDSTWSSEKINSAIPTSLPADGGNADTVNNHTVLSDVPANAGFVNIDDNSTTSTTETWSAKKINNMLSMFPFEWELIGTSEPETGESSDNTFKQTMSSGNPFCVYHSSGMFCFGNGVPANRGKLYGMTTGQVASVTYTSAGLLTVTVGSGKAYIYQMKTIS